MVRFTSRSDDHPERLDEFLPGRWFCEPGTDPARRVRIRTQLEKPAGSVVERIWSAPEPDGDPFPARAGLRRNEACTLRVAAAMAQKYALLRHEARVDARESGEIASLLLSSVGAEP